MCPVQLDKAASGGADLSLLNVLKNTRRKGVHTGVYLLNDIRAKFTTFPARFSIWKKIDIVRRRVASFLIAVSLLYLEKCETELKNWET